MMNFARTVCTLVILSVPTATLGQSRDATKPTREQIAQWVKALGADDFETREQATRKLWQAGQAAEQAVQKALRSDDAEVVRRARWLMVRFRWGIYPDTPAEMLALIQRYRNGDRNVRLQVVRELLQKGSVGFNIVAKFAEAEKDTYLKGEIRRQLARESWRLVQALIVERKHAQAEQTMEGMLASGDSNLVRHYAAFHWLNGTAEQKAKALREEVQRTRDQKKAVILCHLYRTLGDLKSARWAAERSGQEPLLIHILEEARDYKELASRIGSTNQELPRKATYARLAGNEAAFDRMVSKLANLGSLNGTFLFMNDRPDKALKILLKNQRHTMAFDLLVRQGRYQEALKMLPPPGGKGATEVDRVELRKLKLRYRLGNRDADRKKVLAELTRLRTQLQATALKTRHTEFVQNEAEMGLWEQAFKDAERFMARASSANAHLTYLRSLFPKQSIEAQLWWHVLPQQTPGEKPAQVFARIHQLLIENKPGDKFNELVRHARTYALSASSIHDKESRLHTFADACQRLGKNEQALALLREACKVAGTWKSWHKLGDLFARQKKWPEAAQCYRKAHEKDRGEAVPLYLLGWALTQAGQKNEGELLKKRARLLPLANESQRYQLVEALKEHNLSEEMVAEARRLVRTSEFRSVYTANMMSYLSADAVKRKDYLTAADCYQQLGLIVMHSGAVFTNTSAYLLVPSRVHLFQAEAHLAAGRLDRALEEARIVQQFFPIDVGLPIKLIRYLDSKGRKEEANKLFKSQFTRYQQRCKQYPSLPHEHNRLAWLSVRTGRQLDEALTHSLKATQLAPEHTGYLDTLAEVHFQRGESDRAIAVMKRCLKLKPDNAYYTAQLKRFQKGDRAAPLPR